MTRLFKIVTIRLIMGKCQYCKIILINNDAIQVEDKEYEDEDDDNDNDAGGGAFGSHDDIDFNFLHDK